MKLLKFGIVLLWSVTLWGCGKGNANAPVTIDPSTGKHVIGWFDVGTGGAHPATYFADPGSCEECHGKDLKGGISKVSCSPGPNNTGCHDIFPHAAGFNVPAAHGNNAIGVFTSNGIFGMAHCQKCHGLDYTGGAGPSCIKCHREQGSNPATNAPHGANWKVSGRHSKSDATNAAACFKCHAGGAFSHPAQSPAPSGTEPGCFNGTLCHNSAIAHAVPFINATSHGKVIKVTNGWPFCGNCHATSSNGFQRYNVSIGRLANGCETCHKKPNLAHPQMWLPERGDGTPTVIGGLVLVKNTSHIDVPAENIITSCTICHGITAPSANTAVPSCASASGQSIGGIRCHFTSPVDSANGLSNGCKSCHSFRSSSDLANVTSNKHSQHITPINAAFPGLTPVCLACHNSPIPGRGATHADGTPNVAVLAQFGLNATYNSSSKSCSGVSCHGVDNTTPAWTSTNVGCPACHATPPNGTSFPNTANAHAKHIFACGVCHNGAGSGTSKHANGLASAAVVSLLPSQAGAAAAYNPTAKTCANVICHDGRTTTPAWTSSNNGCAACHISPPSTFRHPAHFAAIPDITCDACHTGDGPGAAATHPNGIPVTGLPTIINGSTVNFNENGLTATYNPTSEKCSNLSCHGGKDVPFPPWKSTTIFDPNTLVRCGFSCHTISFEAPASYIGPYIGPFSGNPISLGGLSQGNLHNIHVSSSINGIQINCANCHTLPVPGHFAGILGGRRPLLPGSAAGTVGGLGTSIISYTAGTSSCTTVLGCHTILPVDPRFWY